MNKYYVTVSYTNRNIAPVTYKNITHWDIDRGTMTLSRRSDDNTLTRNIVIPLSELHTLDACIQPEGEQ